MSFLLGALRTLGSRALPKLISWGAKKLAGSRVGQVLNEIIPINEIKTGLTDVVGGLLGGDDPPPPEEVVETVKVTAEEPEDADDQSEEEK